MVVLLVIATLVLAVAVVLLAQAGSAGLIGAGVLLAVLSMLLPALARQLRRRAEVDSIFDLPSDSTPFDDDFADDFADLQPLDFEPSSDVATLDPEPVADLEPAPDLEPAAAEVSSVDVEPVEEVAPVEEVLLVEEVATVEAVPVEPTIFEPRTIELEPAVARTIELVPAEPEVIEPEVLESPTVDLEPAAVRPVKLVPADVRPSTIEPRVVRPVELVPAEPARGRAVAKVDDRSTADPVSVRGITPLVPGRRVDPPDFSAEPVFGTGPVVAASRERATSGRVDEAVDHEAPAVHAVDEPDRPASHAS